MEKKVYDYLDNMFVTYKDIICKKNYDRIDLTKGQKAYDHFISSIENSIYSVIGFTENTNFKVEKPIDYLAFVAKARKVFIDSALNYNQYTSTFNTDAVKGYKPKAGESRYFAFAKDTFDKISSSKLTLKDLNDDALLAYGIYSVANKQIYATTIIDENEHIVTVQKDNYFVKDYINVQNSTSSAPKDDAPSAPKDDTPSNNSTPSSFGII